jgi:hypothetical protein
MGAFYNLVLFYKLGFEMHICANLYPYQNAKNAYGRIEFITYHAPTYCVFLAKISFAFSSFLVTFLTALKSA